MSREVHVRFWEQRGGRFLSLTHFVVAGRTRETLENQALPAIRAFLMKRGLLLLAEKTRIVNIREGFELTASLSPNRHRAPFERYRTR